MNIDTITRFHSMHSNFNGVNKFQKYKKGSTMLQCCIVYITINKYDTFLTGGNKYNI